jgi:hypothetical protein
MENNKSNLNTTYNSSYFYNYVYGQEWQFIIVWELHCTDMWMWMFNESIVHFINYALAQLS